MRSSKPALLACILLLASSSCASDSEYWMFSATRWVWTEGDTLVPTYDDHEHFTRNEEAFLGFVILVVGVPLAIDLLLLPITVPHDLCEN